MFGYVRPVAERLNHEDTLLFQSVYCGLCHTLGQEYGMASRLGLNYDFTFLAILLWDDEDTIPRSFRCPMKMFSKCQRFVSCRALETAADLSVLLLDWKLRDEIRDSAMIQRTLCRMGRWCISPQSMKSVKRHTQFHALVIEKMTALYEMEQKREASMDRAADAFASILSAVAEEIHEEKRRMILRQMLYHLGRWIYLLDALDDLREDALYGRYNPLVERFDAHDGVLEEKSRHRLVATLDHSIHMIEAAYALADYGIWHGILDNIIYCGLPAMSRMVLDGTKSAAMRTRWEYNP